MPQSDEMSEEELIKRIRSSFFGFASFDGEALTEYRCYDKSELAAEVDKAEAAGHDICLTSEGLQFEKRKECMDNDCEGCAQCIKDYYLIDKGPAEGARVR